MRNVFPYSRTVQKLLGEVVASYIFAYSTYAVLLNQKRFSAQHPTGTVPFDVLLSIIAISCAFGGGHALCHINPIVTFGATLIAERTIFEGVTNIIAQFLGTGLAILTCLVTFPGPYTVTIRVLIARENPPNMSSVHMFFNELIHAIMLTFLVLKARREVESKTCVQFFLLGRRISMDPSIMAPIIVGLSKVTVAMSTAGVSLGLVNPALFLMPRLFILDASYLWPYIPSQLLGSALGSVLHTFIMNKEYGS